MIDGSNINVLFVNTLSSSFVIKQLAYTRHSGNGITNGSI